MMIIKESLEERAVQRNAVSRLLYPYRPLFLPENIQLVTDLPDFIRFARGIIPFLAFPSASIYAIFQKLFLIAWPFCNGGFCCGYHRFLLAIYISCHTVVQMVIALKCHCLPLMLRLPTHNLLPAEAEKGKGLVICADLRTSAQAQNQQKAVEESSAFAHTFVSEREMITVLIMFLLCGTEVLY